MQSATPCTCVHAVFRHSKNVAFQEFYQALIYTPLFVCMCVCVCVRVAQSYTHVHDKALFT